VSVDGCKPVILLAFANEQEGHHYLRNLPEELRLLRETLSAGERGGRFRLELLPNATFDEIKKALRDNRDRVAIFHYGGHAGPDRLLLESTAGLSRAVHAEGLARLLGQQSGLKTVFLNGCSTRAQVDGILKAGVPSVIATAREIDDSMARLFAESFYAELASGANLRAAFEAAKASVTAAHGADPDLFRSGERRDLGVESREDVSDVEGFPWDLYHRTEADQVLRWNLFLDDPMHGQPDLPDDILPPAEPFRRLFRFEREHALVFFGRGRQIRELYDLLATPKTYPVVLYHGPTGVGKSSILEAGLLPRLERDYRVIALRRDPDLGLLGTLRAGLMNERQTDVDLATAWKRWEDESGNRPLVVILDQAEEAFTRPYLARPVGVAESEALSQSWIDPEREVRELVEALKAVFGPSSQRPRGKLILGFRMEWLQPFQEAFRAATLGFEPMALGPLERAGIVEAIEGPAKAPWLRGRYGLEIASEEGQSPLAEVVAVDLQADAGSAVAPTLQVLLGVMWDEAKRLRAARPCFDRPLYERLRKAGILLRDFLDHQIKALGKTHPEAAESGFALDLLEYHTTPLGTASKRSAVELAQAYGHTGPLLPPLLQRCTDLYLLTDLGRRGEGETPARRLAHDTLAPLVRERYDRSDLLAQRARRILRSRLPEWERGREGTPLEEHDLAVVERAEAVMRARSGDELRLVEASRRARDREDYDRCRLRAERLLRALGQATGPISRIELDALWELASLPPSEELVRRLVLKRALEEAGTAEQLANRLEPFVHAVVGLSPARRRAILEEDVLPGLRKPAVDPRIPWTCARIGVALGAEDEEFRLLASELLTNLVEAVDIPLDKEALTLARQISSQAAERVTRRLLVDVTDDDPNASGWATEMLEMTGPRLSPADAQQVASQLLEAMTRTRDSHQLARLARGLKAVSQGLSAATSERAAEWFIEVMTHESDLDDLCRLDGGLEEVWPWLPAAAAKRALATLSGARNACVIGPVARHLEQVGPQLLAPDADRATEQLVDAMSRISDRGALETLTRNLQAVVPRLTAAATARAAEQLAVGLQRTRAAVAIRALADGLRVIAQRLPAAEVEHFVEQAAERLFEAIFEAHEADDLRCLGEALGKLGPLLPPGAAEERLAMLGAARTPVEMLRLARALEALGPLLPASEAERDAELVVERLFEAVTKAGDPNDLRYLAEAMKTLVPRMSSEAAPRALGRVIAIIAASRDSLALKDLVDALAAFPGYLDAAKVINLLKYPMCIGPPRGTLLRSLETLTGKAFGGDVWRLVEQVSDLGLAADALVTIPTRT